MSELAVYERHKRVAVIRLNRPEKRNALTQGLIALLHAAFVQARDDEQIRAVILTGNGPAFCAGMDLSELQASMTASPDNLWDDAQRLSQLFDLIYTLPKPTVAAVNGTAVAGGAGLVSVCDLAYAVPTAKFGYPEVRRGLVAAMVLPHLLRHVGERMARHLLLTGELIDAATAERAGLINAVVEPEALMASAMRACEQCIGGGPKALATTKQLLAQFSRQALSIDDLARASTEPRLTPECREGLAAFFANEPPPWTS